MLIDKAELMKRLENIRIDEKTRKHTRCERIIEYMNEFGGITQLEALKELGCFRLASRINDIKRKGYNVRTERITLKNRWGEPVRIARYSFAEGENG